MCDDLGRKRLAYEIRRFQKGHYLELVYLDRGPVVPEIERALRLDDSVLRFLTVQVSPHVEDIEKRKADAAALEEERARKAAERAAREAEEEAARAAEEAGGGERERDRDRDDEEGEAVEADEEE
jgi:small subunit ribosomal protein S6